MRMIYPSEKIHSLASENAHLRTIIKQAEAQIDAILRGQHNGWDRALADVRETLRGV
jgi:hypothetical protein